MTNYANIVAKKNMSVYDKADSVQVKNSSGAYVYALDCFAQLERFLILGVQSGGSYYASEKKLVKENAAFIEECLAKDGSLTVSRIAEVSFSGKALKNEPAIFALALACCAKDIETRKCAFSEIPNVCRIGTDLFTFVSYVKELRSFGKGLRAGIAAWYENKDPEKLAFQICKYAQRNGWSHKDVLRLVHVETSSEAHNAIYRYIVGGIEANGERYIKGAKGTNTTHIYSAVAELPDFIYAFESLKKANEKEVIGLIEKYGFTHEMIPSEHKNSVAVWESLLNKMPARALIRNLNKMTAVGLLKPLSAGTKTVTEKLTNENYLKGARLHPLAVLGSRQQYAKGQGDKGKLVWSPVQQVVSAFETAFYKCFDYVEPTGKNFLFGLDVSGSMTGEIQGTGMSSCMVAACLAMTAVRTEPNTHVFGFADRFIELGINSSDSLESAANKAHRSNFGSTNTGLAIEYAIKHKLDVDAFVVITDNEVNNGRHNSTVIKEYRRSMSKPKAKQIVLATEVNNFTIADPNDPYQIDIPGFSSDVPAVISSFAAME